MSHDSGPGRGESGRGSTYDRKGVVVGITGRVGEVDWCGCTDGGPRWRCVFCGEPAGHLKTEERCHLYRVRPRILRPDPDRGPEAA